MYDFFTTKAAATVRSSSDPVVERLRKARDYLAVSPDRWTQLIIEHYQAVCAIGALEVAAAFYGATRSSLCHDEPNRQAILELSKTLQDRSVDRYLLDVTQPGLSEFARHVMLITKFNDLGTTKYTDVIELFDATINRLCG